MTNVAWLTIFAVGAAPQGIGGAATAAALSAGAICALLWIRPQVRHTTLTGPWLWCLAAAASIGLAEAAHHWHSSEPMPLWLTAARFSAAALALCPAVSVLGSKRPQERAWNFVVLALWAIVSLPSLLSWMTGRNGEFQLTDLRGAILWILIALPAINYLPTRFAAAALLYAGGEVIWFAPHLPLIGKPLPLSNPGLVSLACFAASALLAGLLVARRPAARHRFDQAWLRFRDLFGLFWALRVQERLNATARQQGWPFSLSWSGFRRIDDQVLLDAIPTEHAAVLQQTMRGLLRRFASASWIATWLPEHVD